MIIRQFHTDKFTVTVETEPDYDLDLSWDDTGEVLEQLRSGEYQHFGVKASVTYRGHEIATDYLGGCIYAHPKDFMDHKGIRNYTPPGGKPGQCGSYFSDMVRSVISDARKHLAQCQRVHLRAA